MVGRPRKLGKRGKSGRLIQAYHNPREQVASQPHRLEVAKPFRQFQEAETRFGRLMLNAHITPAQYEAGKQYADISRLYQATILAPAPEPRALSLEASSKGVSAGMSDEKAAYARRAFNAAFNAVEAIALQVAVMKYAVQDQPIPSDDDRTLLTCGLNRLVVHFGIDPRLQITSHAKCRVQ